MFNQLKYSLGGERFIVSNKMDQSLAMLQGIIQPVVLIEVCRGARQKQQTPHELKTLLQALSMLSKWQQSTSMELAHSLNSSHWEVNYKQVMYGHVYILIFPKSTGIPQLVTVTPVNCTTVAVSWSEVQCFNGSGAVTHYLVQYQSMHGRAVQNTV